MTKHKIQNKKRNNQTRTAWVQQIPEIRRGGSHALSLSKGEPTCGPGKVKRKK